MPCHLVSSRPVGGRWGSFIIKISCWLSARILTHPELYSQLGNEWSQPLSFIIWVRVTLITHLKKIPACLLFYISVDLQRKSVTCASPAEFCCGCTTLINFIILPPQKKKHTDTLNDSWIKRRPVGVQMQGIPVGWTSTHKLNSRQTWITLPQSGTVINLAISSSAAERPEDSVTEVRLAPAAHFPSSSSDPLLNLIISRVD